MNMSRFNNYQLIKHTTLKKALNAIKLSYSFIIARLNKKGKIAGYPLAISIEPTTACNLGCPECPSGLKAFSRSTGNLTPEFHKKIIDQIAENVLYINYYFQGEPFINPHFLSFVKYAKSKGIFCATSTNAHFLNTEKAKETVASGLDKMIISIDGTTQETYEKYRKNGSLNKVIEGTKNIMDWKKKLNSKTPYMILQFLVVKHNEHQIDEAKKLSKEIGVDEIRFKTAQVYDYKNGNDLIPENEKYSRYKKTKKGDFVLKNKLYNHCWRMWSSSVITFDGKLVPCCFDKDAKYQIGDLHSSSFKEIWKNKSYQNFRKNILTNRNKIDICQNCTEGTKVWA